MYTNNERTESRTDQPLVWNAPTETQVEKYKKGCTIQSLFLRKSVTIDPTIFYKIDDVNQVPEDYLLADSLFTKYIKTEARTREAREISRQRDEHRFQQLKRVAEELFECQQVLKTFRSYESIIHADGMMMSIKQTMCPSHLLSLYEDILVTKKQWMKICIESESQSECLQWRSERSKRITCSPRAYQIRTRNENFENLGDQFKNNKF